MSSKNNLGYLSGINYQFQLAQKCPVCNKYLLGGQEIVNYYNPHNEFHQWMTHKKCLMFLPEYTSSDMKVPFRPAATQLEDSQTFEYTDDEPDTDEPDTNDKSNPDDNPSKKVKVVVTKSGSISHAEISSS